ncbi:hypothetical protein MOVS_09695 [Moraxella ovis]|uniref:Dephospho-CoA kinase n=1 Tax=Moraxella ovis TaxID=29433 RepID=A0A160GH67_9GAMM|nr:dephospho-CoA kinase [Moraxella ovis]ANB92193.1 hypothetical protein MOVS_09695 [Moraxella ovis]SPX81637.1 Dephospho-CoA kinase [Moraxella ovis]STY87987.1 Dephospho-CoA kinase [Moraxella ovis]STZ05877.1 Dephospho-CoA kinase [Moraxella ovis]
MSELIIGLTGGIGSGKSAVSDWFAMRGIDVVDADVIAHAITAKGSPVLDELKEAFGDWVIDSDGNYNRAAMREHILKHPAAITTLNAITHPHIQAQIKDALTKSTSTYCILSVPLLVEGMAKSPNLAELCDRILVVDVPESTQIDRATKRDQIKLSHHQDPIAYVKTIIAKQATRQQRLAVADDVVDNGGTLDELYVQLERLHEGYLAMVKC